MLSRSDPYLVWTDLLAAGAATAKGSRPKPTARARMISVLLELAGAGVSYWDELFNRVKSLRLAHTNSVLTYGKGRYFSCTLDWEDLHELVKLAAEAKVERFVLSMPRFVELAALNAIPAKLLRIQRRQEAILQKLLSERLLERMRPVDPPGARPFAGSTDGAHAAVADEGPLVCVIDDRCNFASHRLLDAAGLPRVASIWDQDDNEKTRKQRRACHWGDAGDVDRSSGVVQDDDPRPRVDGRPLRRGAASGSNLNLRDRYNQIGHVVANSSELASYKTYGYLHPPARWSHGSSILDLVAGPELWLGGQRLRWSDPPNGIRFVQLPEQTVQDTTGGSLDSHVIDAIQHALEEAQVGRDVIVNLSFGTNGGPHDGTSVFESALLELLRWYDGSLAAPAFGRRLHVVLPAGNTHLWRCHASGWLTSSRPSRELLWKIQPDDGTDNFLEISLPDQGAVEVTLTPPGQPELAAVVADQAVYWSGADGVVHAAVIYPRRAANTTVGTMALVAVGPTQRRSDDPAPVSEGGLPRRPVWAPHGVWKVKLRSVARAGQPVADVRFDAWIQRGDAAPGRARAVRGYRGRQSYFLEEDECSVDPRGTLNGIATASDPDQTRPRLWVVGAMRHSDLNVSDYSAAGPTRVANGRFGGPDVVTVADESLNLPGLLVGGVLAGARVRVSGTSLAAGLFTRLLFHHLARSNPPRPMVWSCLLPSSRIPTTPAGAPQHADPMHRGDYVRLHPTDIHEALRERPASQVRHRE